MTHGIRRLLVFLFFICITSVYEGLCSKQPHILFIVADDLGYGDVGYHGSEIRTPNIDRLANAGVTLENYYVQPMCTPSRSCFLTGRYPIRTGLQHGVIAPKVPAGLPLNERTLANALHDVGYATHIVGKWHLGFYKAAYTPLNRGFQSHYGYYLGEQNYFSHSRDHGYDWRDNWDISWEDKGLYSTHMITDRAEKIIRHHNHSQPLFLYLSYQAVHKPWFAPEKYSEPYKHITDETRRTYCGVVACLDESIGNITKTLQELHLWEDTIIIFTSDNGGVVPIQSNFPLRGGKNSLFEGGLRVPAFVYSEMIKTAGKSGRVSHDLIHAVDWYPTLIQLAGGSLEQSLPIDGVNIWPTLAEATPSARKEVLLDIDPVIPMAAVRVGDWKLITGVPCITKPKNANCGWYTPPSEAKDLLDVNEDGVWLFNITEDPTERVDVHKKYPAVVKQLQERLKWYEKGMVPPQTAEDDPKAEPSLHGGIWEPWAD